MDNGTTVGDAGIARAFERGQSAERNYSLRSQNPYRPSEDGGALYNAWNDGFDYECQLFTARV